MKGKSQRAFCKQQSQSETGCHCCRTPFICNSIHYFCFIAVYVTLSFQLSGRVGAKILFVFGMNVTSVKWQK
ncbi:MAG: hypothetical protein SO064_06510 [Prevotella sp.]|nr:hypothetical protein [Prevotella sp.]